MTESIETASRDKFSLGFYVHALTGMLGSPSRFFKELPGEIGYRQPFGFLLMSSLFLTGASLTLIRERPFLMAGILMANAIGMTFITAGISFVVVTMSMGKRMTFSRLFAVYAFSSGVTMLASWIPLFVWITEPWKWILVAIGMVKGCGLNRKQAIIILSMFIVILFFSLLGPVSLSLIIS